MKFSNPILLLTILSCLSKTTLALSANDFGLVSNNHALDLSKMDRLAITPDLLKDEESLKILGKHISVIYVPVEHTTVVATVTKTITDISLVTKALLPTAINKEQQLTSLTSNWPLPTVSTPGKPQGALDFIIGGNTNYHHHTEETPIESDSPSTTDELTESVSMSSSWDSSTDSIITSSLENQVTTSSDVVTKSSILLETSVDTDCESSTKLGDESISTPIATETSINNVDKVSTSEEELTTTSTIINTLITSSPEITPSISMSFTDFSGKVSSSSGSTSSKKAKSTKTSTATRTSIPLFGNVTYTFPFENETVSGYNPYMGLPTSPINFNGSSSSGGSNFRVVPGERITFSAMIVLVAILFAMF